MSLGIDEMIQNYLSRLEPEYIDSFRQLVAASIDAEFQKVEARYENQSAREYESPELRCLHGSMIEDDGVYVGYIQELAHELSIVALYKIFEKKNKELITHHRKEEESKKYSTWDNVLIFAVQQQAGKRTRPRRALRLNQRAPHSICCGLCACAAAISINAPTANP
jgi:hypothetical protein